MDLATDECIFKEIPTLTTMLDICMFDPKSFGDKETYITITLLNSHNLFKHCFLPPLDNHLLQVLTVQYFVT